MRPVSRPPWTPRWQGHPTADVVLHALGRYCTTCERALPQAAVAWDVSTWAPASPRATSLEWGNVIVLCLNCAFAAASRKPSRRAPPLIPDRDRTFALDMAASPISYTIHPVALAGEGDASTSHRAVVRPTPDERAVHTVELFALNTPFYDDVLGALVPRRLPLEHLHLRDPLLRRIAEVDWEEADAARIDFWDPRLELRTHAWEAAMGAAAALRDAGPHRDVLMTAVRRLAGTYGFWSVWATVLWEHLRDVRLLRLVLLPSGTGGMEPFPGTRSDWLPDRGPSESSR